MLSALCDPVDSAADNTLFWAGRVNILTGYNDWAEAVSHESRHSTNNN